ncbi:Ras GTPase [Venturia nashicola]|uniref:Ras GTPase n=1 Tax=Venturia nashicola TaxID=86259 RepID=A0A4Z1PM89_9PEZI|nr:Ras GTPase [Venturia nashicola]
MAPRWSWKVLPNGTENAEAQFVQNIWIESYDPTIEDTYHKTLEVDGRQVLLEVLDTAGTEQFTAMRELYMKSGQGFLLVFSITSLSSLQELIELRDEIIRIKDDPLIPIVLVGNKCDLEEDRAVSRARAFSVSQSWGNAPYYETSARRKANVDESFRDLCRQIIRRDQEAMKAQGHERPIPIPLQREDLLKSRISRDMAPGQVKSSQGHTILVFWVSANANRAFTWDEH